MEQSIQYLYEYQDGKKVRNIGFMKIEKQMDKCTIQIHAKQMDDIKGLVFERGNKERYTGCWEPELYELPAEEPETGAMQEMEVEEYISPRNVTYEKIQRQGLSRLPRKEWRLANNSFLLHGFYNYHHLLYIEDDGKIWIGVPGVYHEKEKLAANAFGFTDFRRITDVQIDLEENEKNTYDDFGYWCRQILDA